jgi:isocitrate dehydrogenase (NAD+)
VLCGLVGGPGLVSGGNYNAENGLAIFEQATRNAGRKISGKNMANPTAYLVATSKVHFHK